jgi:cephalosporin hydroxylase
MMWARIRAALLGKGLGSPDASSPARNLDSSEFEVDNWVISSFVLAKLVPVVGVRPFPLHEQMLMCAAVCQFQPPLVFEWGTHVGKSARVFYECARYYGIPVQIHSVDLPDTAGHVEHPGEMRGRLVRGLPGVHLHQGDGIEVSLATWKASGRPRSPLFYIDGDHAYESVLRELSAIAAEVPAANILLHDTFNQSNESGYNVGPHRAIEDVLRAYPGRYRRFDSGLGLPGMTLLYRLRP